jgi:hypothetical protein
MAIRLPSHLHRARSGILHFRIAIPPDLYPYFTTREIYRSLRTASVHDAAPAAQALAQAAKRVFVRFRTQSMSSHKKARTGPSDGCEIGLITELSIDEYRNPRLKLIPEPGDTPEDRIQAQVEFLRAVAIADTGGKSGAAKPAPNQALHAHSYACADVEASTTPVLSSYLEQYLAKGFVTAKPTRKTLDSYRAAIGLFIDIVGDKPLCALCVVDQNRFEDTIGKVPANRIKIASTRALSLDEMINFDLPKLSPQSTKNIAQRTNNFLIWAFRREGSKPPFELMGNVRITARSKTVQRRAFTEHELTTLFSTATYAQGRQQSPYMYWLPLIGLHTGMRINEIAQLELADIASQDGIIVLSRDR